MRDSVDSSVNLREDASDREEQMCQRQQRDREVLAGGHCQLQSEIRLARSPLGALRRRGQALTPAAKVPVPLALRDGTSSLLLPPCPICSRLNLLHVKLLVYTMHCLDR